MLTKRFFFCFTTGTGKASVNLFLRKKNGKFEITHQLHSSYLFNWFQAYWYWLLFNLPKWIKNKTGMFKYNVVNGRVRLCKLDIEMIK